LLTFYGSRYAFERELFWSGLKVRDFSFFVYFVD